MIESDTSSTWRSLRLRRVGALAAITTLIAVLLAVPVVVVLANVFMPSEGTWAHLAGTVLPEYVANTLWLLAGVGGMVIFGGVATAWLVTMCRFPGQRLFEWTLILPLAMPAYIMAYAYTDFLQFSGPLQTWLRELTGWQAREYWFPEIRSVEGAIAMLGLVLYPYVYLVVRAAFLEQSVGIIEVGRTLGYGAWSSFFRLALPLARPAIAAGTTLALMETLADFGTVSYFAVPTFTTGIYHAWLSLGDRVAAAQLSALLLGFVRKRPVRYQLRGAPAFIAVLICCMPLVLGFALPSGLLLRMALTEGDAQFGARFVTLTLNSFTLAGVTALAGVMLALVMAYALRLSPGPLTRAANRLAGLGYAIPGAVIAIGILVPVARLDNAVDAWMRVHFDISTGLLLTGSITALVYAYLVRFLTVALQTVEAGLTRITPSMDEAARSLGVGPLGTLLKVHGPLMRGSLLTAGLLVFIDVMKELPATFVMRPFNFDTLAVQAYNLAVDERLAEASTSALAIVAVSLLPLIVLSLRIARTRTETARVMDLPKQPAPLV
ncbi:MAG: iron ABC transporter permease [Betaproteobacteria bacterium]|nr:iron ABC transporter permease [Betaproteobacteria bacterium]